MATAQWQVHMHCAGRSPVTRPRQPSPSLLLLWLGERGRVTCVWRVTARLWLDRGPAAAAAHGRLLLLLPATQSGGQGFPGREDDIQATLLCYLVISCHLSNSNQSYQKNAPVLTKHRNP